jgi:membrane associated rhomboid family serine protease
MEIPRRSSSEPMLNAPPVLLGLIAVTAIAFVATYYLPPEVQQQVVYYFALYPARYATSPDGVRWIFPGGWGADVWSFFTYVFLHGSWGHLFVNMIWLLAFGAPVCRRIGQLRFLFFYFTCGALAGVLYVLVHLGEIAPAVGASGAISGLMAAAARFVFVSKDPGFINERPVSRADASIGAALKNRNVLIFVGLWLGLNFLFGPTGLTPTGEAVSIAWEAHLGGFLAGLLLFGLFDPMRPSPSGGPGNVNYGEWRRR